LGGGVEIEIDVEYGLSVAVEMYQPQSTAWCNASTRIYPMNDGMVSIIYNTSDNWPSPSSSIIISGRL